MLTLLCSYQGPVLSHFVLQHWWYNRLCLPYTTSAQGNTIVAHYTSYLPVRSYWRNFDEFFCGRQPESPLWVNPQECITNCHEVFTVICFCM
jgi:hypothetical protein